MPGSRYRVSLPQGHCSPMSQDVFKSGLYAYAPNCVCPPPTQKSHLMQFQFASVSFLPACPLCSLLLQFLPSQQFSHFLASLNKWISRQSTGSHQGKQRQPQAGAQGKGALDKVPEDAHKGGHIVTRPCPLGLFNLRASLCTAILLS